MSKLVTRPIVTLTTDFGLRDPSVGSMKGVIISMTPDVMLVDLTHDIPRHAVAAASYVLTRTAHYFPPGSIHLAVVDPGVGSSRRPLVGSAGGHRYVGPDNGLFAETRNRDRSSEWFEITNPRYWLKPPHHSPTFQGRDVFAPAAAWLAGGAALQTFGPRLMQLATLDPETSHSEQPKVVGSRQGSIIWVDRFGNLISGIEAGNDVGGLAVSISGREVRFVGHYAEAPTGEPAAIVNSDALVEVFINRGDASAMLGAGVGTPIALVRAGRGAPHDG
jgi:hypothetical protein